MLTSNNNLDFFTVQESDDDSNLGDDDNYPSFSYANQPGSNNHGKPGVILSQLLLILYHEVWL